MLKISLIGHFNYLRYSLPVGVRITLVLGAAFFEDEFVPAGAVLPVAGVPTCFKSV
jgi:hypothetical protein